MQQDEKNEEFKIIANEITRLREEAVTIKRLNQRLSNRLQQIMKNDVKNFQNINNLSREQMRALLIKYANGHKTEKNRRKHLEKTMVKLLAKLKASKKIYHKLIKIQTAAQEQAEFIRTLQGRQDDVEQYRETIISQEEVIEKLEEMLSWAHQTIKTMQTKMDSGMGMRNVASNRERDLENEIISLQQENEEIRKQLQNNNNGGVTAMGGDVDDLRDELKEANIKNDGLQNQLKAGAGLFGEQIAALKLQVRKLQSESDDDMFSDLSDGTVAGLSELGDLLDSVSISASIDV